MRFQRLLAATILFFALASSIAFAARMPVAAVDLEDNGLLAYIELTAKPGGTGQIFLNISTSLVEVDTQRSLRTALHEAAHAANTSETLYDFQASIVSRADSINGPSAGAAFAVLAYSEYTGKIPREDLTITGTIEDGGIIGRVGGVREKAQAVGNSSKIKVMAVPAGQSEESEIGLSEELGIADEALEKWGLRVIEITNLSEAIALAFSQKGTVPAQKPRATIESSLGAFNYSQKTERLRELAMAVVQEIEQDASAPNANYTSPVKNSIERSLSSTRTLLGKGYFYSGANAAFIVKNQLDALNLRNQSASALLLETKRLLAEANAIVFAEKTPQNWEWVTGAQLRQYWARDKLSAIEKELANQTDSNASEGAAAKYSYDLASAGNWLGASKRMNEIAKSLGGNEGDFNESKFAEYAAELLSQTRSEYYNGSKIKDSEIAWHLDVAKSELEGGAILASIFDSYFARAYTEAQFELLLLENANLTAIKNLVASTDKKIAPKNGAWNSIWAEAYFAHSKYSESEAERLADNYYLLNALKLKKLAMHLEQNEKFMRTGAWILPKGLNETANATAEPFLIEIPETEEGVPAPAICGPQKPAGQTGPEPSANASNESAQSQTIQTEITITPNYSANGLIATAIALLAIGTVAAIWIATRKPLDIKARANKLKQLHLQGKIGNDEFAHKMHALKAIKAESPKKKVSDKK